MVRSLKAKDVRTVARLLASDLDRITAMAAERPGETVEARQTRIGVELAKALLERHIDTLWAWLADLDGKTPAELDEAPPERPLEIVHELAQSGALEGFFERARALAGTLRRTGAQDSGTA